LFISPFYVTIIITKLQQLLWSTRKLLVHCTSIGVSSQNYCVRESHYWNSLQTIYFFSRKTYAWKLIRFHRHYCSCKQFSQHQQVVAFLLLLLRCSTITSSWRTIARTWWWSYLVRIYANSMEPKKTRLMLLQVSITMTWILFIPRLQGNEVSIV